ncbi:MAG: SsrA-binding protein [Gemmatales bacterium]|nr:MAG: SsrA-binding protein [Gemmatales bacterium]
MIQWLLRDVLANVGICYDLFMAKTKKQRDDSEGIKLICRNKKAYHEYTILDRLECGLVLTGTEVKSLREGGGSIEDAYAKVEDGEVWLIGSDIPEYTMGNRLNHKPKRKRKLLLHAREIQKFASKATERGLTLVPLRMYFRRGLAKVELAVARGRQLHDKREAKKKSEAQREIKRELSQRRR